MVLGFRFMGEGFVMNLSESKRCPFPPSPDTATNHGSDHKNDKSRES